MTVAFVITSAEEEIVDLIAGEDTPHMNGSLFTFKRDQLPAFLNAIADWGTNFGFSSEEFRAAARLQERIGTWLGRNQPVAPVEAPSPAPRSRRKSKSVDIATVEPETPVEPEDGED